MTEKKVVVSEWDSAPFLQKWTFSVANPLLREGQKTSLQFDDLLQTPLRLTTQVVYTNLKNSYATAKRFLFIPKLMNALNYSNLHMIIINTIFTLMESALRIASPVVLGIFLRALIDKTTPVEEAYKYACILGGMNLLQTFLHGISFFFAYGMGVGWRMSSIALIFDKLFHVRSESFANGTGKLVNLISNDVSRFDEWGVFMVFYWETYLELIAIFVILVYSLSVLPALAGVGTFLILIPPQLKLANDLAAQRTSIAIETDSRVRHTSEVIEGITSVKSFGWEKPFTALIGVFRAKEVSFISKSQYLRSIFQGIYYSGSVLATFATFSVFWAQGRTITIPLVFSTLSMIQVLKAVVSRNWTRAIETGSEATASCTRIDNFLNMPDALKEVSSPDEDANFTGSLVRIQNGVYGYAEAAVPTLRGVNIDVKPGELVIVVGKVGCGKSSYLNAVLGEMTVLEGGEGPFSRKINPSTRIAYCAQRPWILASSVRENIVLASETSEEGSDEDLYKLAVESCCIVQDMSHWPAYDLTEIGERGVSVSGGQKARIALARAVYSNAPLCVLDDPLSAVDASVSKALFFDCIIAALRNRGKGVVLATHQLQYLQNADRVVVLDKTGTQVFYGSYEEMQSRSFELLGSLTASTTSAKVQPGEKSLDGPPDSSHDVTRESSRDMLSQLSAPPTYDPSMRITKENETKEQEERRQIIQKEDRVEGASLSSVYIKYMASGGIGRGILTLLMALASQVLLMISDYWIRWWASATFFSQRDPKNLWIFAILSSCCVVMGFVRALMWFDFTLLASSHFHDKCLQGVLHAPLAFFVANPTGRILNRFSRDQNIIDELLPVVLFDVIQSSLLSVSAFILVFIAVYYMVCFLPILGYLIYYLREKYTSSSLDIKRIESTLRSPVYSMFSSTLEGLVTLRAYRLESRMKDKFFRLLDGNSRAMFSLMLINRWFGLRLDALCASFVLLVSVLACSLRDSVNVGLLGFAIMYLLSVSALFQWTVRQTAEVESQMTSVERLDTYVNLPPEAYRHLDSDHMAKDPIPLVSVATDPKSQKDSTLYSSDTNSEQKADPKDLTIHSSSLFPYKRVIFSDFTATYRLDLDPVLKGLTVDIPFGSKVGVCGRTGSGKSSFLLALLRLNIITKGDMRLDDESLVHMALEDSRNLISLIPQEPHLFSGTLRFNLDPFNRHTDLEIWAALEDAHIRDYVSRDPLGLQALVEEGGKNFSVGQRQLLSLARAILRRRPIVLMDEVSASIDYATDVLIQETIRKSPALKDSTIFTIAHRLRTIADSDYILVISAGSLVEHGAPYDLLLKGEESPFRKLVEESNEFDDILELAKGAKSKCN